MITADRLPHLTPAELANPASDLGVPDFCDWRVFAVPGGYYDSRVAAAHVPDCFDVGQPHDGPAYIFVGANVTDERLARRLPTLSQQYGVTMEQLQKARAGNLVPVRIDRPASWAEPRAHCTAEEVL